MCKNKTRDSTSACWSCGHDDWDRHRWGVHGHVNGWCNKKTHKGHWRRGGSVGSRSGKVDAIVDIKALKNDGKAFAKLD